MLNKTLALTALCLTGCATPTVPNNTLQFDDAEAKYVAQYKQWSEDEQYQGYMQLWLDFNNNNAIDSQGKCYFLGEEDESIVLVLDEGGRVVDVAVDHNNKMTQCFRRTFLGVVYPKPPFAPYYNLMRMKGMKS